MHLLLSPAKTLDMERAMEVSNYSLAPFLNEAKELIAHLKKLRATDLQNLMGVSSKIAELNANRFEKWELPFDLTNSKQAIFAFKGDVYTGLEAESFTETEIAYAQKNLSILSGLYGILKPLDLMQAYRLEMGTKLPNKNGENLYKFWGTKIASEINEREQDIVVNLASNEYFKAVAKNTLTAKVITPVFKDEKNGVLKVISFFAKKARGMMARFIIQNHLSDVNELKNFNSGGYAFSETLSTEKEWVFTR